jgi:hypothetical protein
MSEELRQLGGCFLETLSKIRQAHLTHPLGQEARASSQSKNVATEKTQVVLTPKEIIAITRPGELFVYPPDTGNFRGRPFDVRALGLYYWAAFHENVPFEQIHDILSKHKPREIERDPEGRWRIVWEFTRPARSQDTVWIDEVRGFTVVRSETRFPLSNVDPVVWGEPTFTNVVTWALEDEIWVPKTFKIENRVERAVRSYDLAFEWESVNKPVPDRWFSVDGLDISERTEVYDMTTGQRILREILNDSPKFATFYPGPAKQPRLLWIVMFNAALTAIAITVFCVWRVRRQSRKPPAS